MSEEDIKQTATQPAGSDAKSGDSQTGTKSKSIIKRVSEEDAPLAAGFTLRNILGGDFLTADFMRKQIGVIILVAFMTMIYVSNRYSCQQDMIEINELQKELKDAKYKALASSSQLTEICRESNVLDMLRNNKDSVLHIPNQPPYIITVPENE